MRQRALYLFKFYVATLLFFVAAKIGFMLYQHGGHNFTFTDMLQVIGHGLSLDLSTSLYIIAVPFLLVAASLWLRIPKWCFRIYYAFAAVLLMVFPHLLCDCGGSVVFSIRCRYESLRVLAV